MQKMSEKNSGNVSIVPWVCALIGLGFLLLPELIVDALSLILGGLCILIGIWKLGACLFSSNPVYTGIGRIGSLLGGLAVLLLGTYIINHAERVFSLLPIAAGIFFLLDGLDRIRSAFMMRRMESGAVVSPFSGKTRFLTALLIGILTLGIGIFLLFYPFGAVKMTVRIIGILILVDALGALWTDHALKTVFRAVSSSGTRAPDGKYNAAFRDISDEQ